MSGEVAAGVWCLLGEGGDNKGTSIAAHIMNQELHGRDMAVAHFQVDVICP